MPGDVTSAELEERLGKALPKRTPEEMARLAEIVRSRKRGQSEPGVSEQSQGAGLTEKVKTMIARVGGVDKTPKSRPDVAVRKKNKGGYFVA